MRKLLFPTPMLVGSGNAGSLLTTSQPLAPRERVRSIAIKP